MKWVVNPTERVAFWWLGPRKLRGSRYVLIVHFGLFEFALVRRGRHG